MYICDENKSKRNKQKHGLSFEQEGFIRIISVRRGRYEEEKQARDKGL